MDGNGKNSTKELKSTLKVALNNISNQDFNSRIEIVNYNKDSLSKFRNPCKNGKTHILQVNFKDYFNVEKMFKYKIKELQMWEM
jgi:hypothetical protein